MLLTYLLVLETIPLYNCILYEKKLAEERKSVAYSSEGSHTGQLDFCY